MWRQRARSPLRWLWVVTSALGILALAGVTSSAWLVVAIPLVAVLLLVAPPVGIFRHDETPPPRTDVRIDAREVAAAPGDPPGARRFLLTLVNDGDVPAAGFRIRLLVPALLWPRGTRGSPLGRLCAGAFGKHWFIESVYDDTSLTFRAGPLGDAAAIGCPPGGRLDLAELVVVNLDHWEGGGIEYQINGGTVRTILGRLQV